MGLISSYLHSDFSSYTKISPQTVEIKRKIINKLQAQRVGEKYFAYFDCESDLFKLIVSGRFSRVKGTK